MCSSIKSLNKNQLKEVLVSLGEKEYRLNQILDWLYVQNVTSFDSMTNLSKNLRVFLKNSFCISSLKIHNKEISKDGTIKYIFSSNYSDDTIYFETVGIPDTHSSSLTVCVSSQAGCKIGCQFCATAKQCFFRSLYVGEIVEQVLLVQEDFNIRVSNVVVMGQGEPFLNFENVMDALSIINNPKGIGIGARKITVSTSGILKGIRDFSNCGKQYTLAISLHSAIQQKRDLIMPGVKNFTLDLLKNQLLEYNNLTNRRITLEYLMIDSFNDTNKDLNSLIQFTDNLKCHINLLPLNKIENSIYKCSNKSTIDFWLQTLNNNNIPTTFRKSRGTDINGACGQLINKDL